MDYNVVEARYVSGYTIWLRFRDGRPAKSTSGPSCRVRYFEPLKDVEYFRKFEIHPEFQTLVWPNGADRAPEFQHERPRVATQDAR
jgi:hypothetical protein